MNQPRILLHVGAHKTGTTAIQAFAARHHSALAQRGLHYPLLRTSDGRLRSNSHNPLAHQFAHQSRPDHYGPAWLQQQLEAAGSGSLLLSAEALWRHGVGAETTSWVDRRRAYLERVANWFSPWPVEVVVVLREQAAFAHSVYLENIMKGTRRGRMAFNDFRSFLEQRHLQFFENLRLLESHLGPIHLLSYDEFATGNSLCHRFFKSLDVDTTDLAEPGRVRASLSYRQARLKRTLIPLMRSSRINAATNALLRRWLRNAGEHHQAVGFWASPQERGEWQDQYAEENEQIRAHYRPDLVTLFPEGR